MSTNNESPAALLPCPTCGAPCKPTVHSRGGDWGWSTTDKERTTYEYTAPGASESRGSVPDGFVLVKRDLVESAMQTLYCASDGRENIYANTAHEFRDLLELRAASHPISKE